MILQEDQVKQIVFLLKSRNEIESQQVLDEMTDHFCCLVEKRMISGSQFDEALAEVTELLNPEETKAVEKSWKKIRFSQRLKRKVRSITAVAATLVLLLVAGADAQNKPTGLPIKGDAEVTSDFGMRKHPDKKVRQFHRGIDLRAEMRTPLYATADGTVSETQFSDKGYGIKLVIDHAEGYQTLFSHLADIIVKKGEKIKKGDLIAYTGNSGQSKGPHLHYEIKKDGKFVDPKPLIDADKK
ncbi:MAG: M23 family metallopeptidase [Bacteroidota bacterium]